MLRPFLVFLAIASLACAAGKDKNTDPNDEQGTQSEACADYLDCAAEVDPSTFATLGSTYGPDGDCWSQGDAYADACTSACEAALDAMHAAYPDAEVCGGGGGPTSCPLDAGDHELILHEPDTGTCGFGGDIPGDAEVTCDDPSSSTFTLHWVDIYGEEADLDCTFSGTSFTCEGILDVGTDADLTLDGDASGGSAAGRYTLDIPELCAGEGDFDMD